jgi:CheY-like chemotaxis protein
VEKLFKKHEPKLNDTTILIVEDHLIMLSLLSWDIRHKIPASHILTAVNGAEGLLKARQAQPDLIITDLMMPVMDGYEMVQSLRQEQNARQIPVIGISGHESTEAKTVAFRTVCDEFLAKPFDPQELLEKVSLLVSRQRSVTPS